MARLVLALAAGLLLGVGVSAGADRDASAGESADMALVLAVDVSGSVDAERYVLQMEGIARTFEDRQIQDAILAGQRHAIFVTLVEWSNRPVVTVPWTLIGSATDARAFAGRIRAAPRADDQFTCMAAALELVAGKVLPFLPGSADRLIIDVSGDGRDNCNPKKPMDAVRDEIVAAGITINGLPILEGEEAATLEQWYREHVIGGHGSFLIPAAGFNDFERAMRRKFIAEVSGVPRRAPAG
jgi:Protein of unknown function (DUF1194)